MRYSPNALLKSCGFMLLYCFMLAGQTNALAGETIRINGSGTGLEMMKPLIEVYVKSHPGVTFEMQKPLGSSGAIKALIAGALDIAITSKPLKADEVTKGAKVIPFGKTPLAIVTNKKVQKKNILTTELEAIYSGKTRKWPNDENIRVVLRPLEDIDTKILRTLSPGMDRAISEAQNQKGMLTAVTDPESNEAVLRTEGSIGASGLAAIMAGNLPLNILSLNGILPTPTALANGRYPLAKDINFVTTGKLPAAAAEFLDFIYSIKGHAIVEKIGVLVTAGHRADK